MISPKQSVISGFVKEKGNFLVVGRLLHLVKVCCQPDVLCWSVWCGEPSVTRGFWQDDIIDDVDSFLAAAETLKERGAYKIFVMATHGLLSSDAPRLIEESAIDEVSLESDFLLI